MLSRISWFLCVAVMFYASFIFYPRWKMPGGNASISWDVSGYYWYLPSAFIYKDIKGQGFKDSILARYKPTATEFQQGFKTDNGNYVMKYASGMAVMYLPFFVVAHAVAGPLGYPSDGFSAPYQFAIQLGGFLISILGLWYLRKLLLLYYDDKVTAIVLLLIAIGSNYIIYSAIYSGMSHCWLFTVYVFLLLNTHYFYQSFRLKYAIRIGLLVGLATLTRPTDVVACTIPLLWGMEGLSPATIKDRIRLVIGKAPILLVAVLCAACVVSIQLIYWKYASGHWLTYSYQDQHLYFRSPNFLNYTLSYRSGWLTYSPMMVLAFVGLIPFLKHGRNKVAVTTFFLLNYYIVCAWSIWWYGGRAMVQSYPVLAFPLAALVAAAINTRWVRRVLAPVVLLFLYFNAWFVYQSHKGDLFEIDNMTGAYFWRVAGRWRVPEETKLLRDNEEQQEQVRANMQLVYQNNFDKDTGVIYREAANGPGRVLYLTHDNQWSEPYRLVPGAARHLRADAVFHAAAREWDTWKMAQFIVRSIGKDGLLKERIVRPHRLLQDGETQRIWLDITLPEHTDSVHVLFWNGESAHAIAIDSLRVWVGK